MADYIELEGTPKPFDLADAEIETMKWKNKAFSLHLISKSGHPAKVQMVFRNVIAIRLLDGLALDSEDGTMSSGIRRRALAYMVEGSQFWKDHVELLADYPGAKHYRVVTLYASVDIISETQPAISRLDVVS